MPEFNPAHRTPPPETTPEEAERNKRTMGETEAPLKRENPRNDGDGNQTPDPDKTGE